VAARKLRIKDVIAGRIVSDDDSKNSLVTNFGESREVRVCGTVVSKFISDDENYGNLVLDDGSESIQLKFWRSDVDTVRRFEAGDFTDVLANVREYNDEKYLQPVQLFKRDVHGWIRFHLDVALSIKGLVEEGSWSEAQDMGSLHDVEEQLDEYDEMEKNFAPSNDDSFEEDSIVFDDDDINRTVMDAMGKDPMSKEEIIKKTMLDEIDVMLSIKELLENGDIFEIDGKYKRL